MINVLTFYTLKRYLESKLVTNRKINLELIVSFGAVSAKVADDQGTRHYILIATPVPLTCPRDRSLTPVTLRTRQNLLVQVGKGNNKIFKQEKRH